MVNQMAETNEQPKKTDPSWDGRTIATIAIATGLAQIITRNIDWLPFPLGLMLAYLVVLLVGYWIGRRPPVNFGRFALTVVGYLLLLTAGIWAVPELLSKLIWRQLAFGGSILAFGILAYWLPPLYPNVGQKKQPALWVWVICVTIVAVVWGYFATDPNYLR